MAITPLLTMRYIIDIFQWMYNKKIYVVVFVLVYFLQTLAAPKNHTTLVHILMYNVFL